MTLTDEQKAELGKPLDRAHVSTRSQSGRSLSYIEGWHAIAEANRIFGFDGWTRETVEMREVRPLELVKSSAGKETWRVGFIAKVRITAGGVVREGTGYGSGALPDPGEAYESATKEAETDAMKRALMTFGNPFGLALYDKGQTAVQNAPRAAAAPSNADLDEAASRSDLIRRITNCATPVALDALSKDPDFVAGVKSLSPAGRKSVISAGERRREEVAQRTKPSMLHGDEALTAAG